MPSEDEILTLAEAGEIIDRSAVTMRVYAKREGLPHHLRGNRIAVRRGDFDEWRARPEIAAMLRAGDHLKRRGRSPYKSAV